MSGEYTADMYRADIRDIADFARDVAEEKYDNHDRYDSIEEALSEAVPDTVQENDIWRHFPLEVLRFAHTNPEDHRAFVSDTENVEDAVMMLAKCVVSHDVHEEIDKQWTPAR